MRKYPEAPVLGGLPTEELLKLSAGAAVFVFPSVTDTFGNVLLEALASGLPVAAFPVTGPLDVIGNSPVGVLADDLRMAALLALHAPRETCRDFALRHNWDESARRFLANIRDAVVAPVPDVTSAGEHSSVAA
jgi:glycosyltransferase involved in cell wall biosynthesis